MIDYPDFKTVGVDEAALQQPETNCEVQFIDDFDEIPDIPVRTKKKEFDPNTDDVLFQLQVSRHRFALL